MDPFCGWHKMAKGRKARNNENSAESKAVVHRTAAEILMESFIEERLVDPAHIRPGAKVSNFEFEFSIDSRCSKGWSRKA